MASDHVWRRGLTAADLHEVALATDDESPIGAVEECGDGVPTHSWVRARSRHEPGVEDHEHEHDEQGRKQPPGSARPERSQGDSARTGPLRDQEGRDQKARQDEEGVDAEEPRRQERHPAVVGHDRQDGEGPHPVECGHVGEPMGSPRRRSGVARISALRSSQQPHAGPPLPGRRRPPAPAHHLRRWRRSDRVEMTPCGMSAASGDAVGRASRWVSATASSGTVRAPRVAVPAVVLYQRHTRRHRHRERLRHIGDDGRRSPSSGGERGATRWPEVNPGRASMPWD